MATFTESQDCYNFIDLRTQIVIKAQVTDMLIHTLTRLLQKPLLHERHISERLESFHADFEKICEMHTKSSCSLLGSQY